MPVRYGMNTALIAVFLIVGHFIVSSGMLSGAQNSVILQIGIFAILAVSLNVATGYLGQLPLGHAGFMAVGAYAGALFWRASPISGTPDIIAGIILAGVVAALFGVIIGIPALRLRGDYLAIITLGFGEIIRVIIRNLPEITGGTPGLLGIPRYSNFFIIYLCLVFTCVIIHMIMKSRHGRAIISIRENEIAAESCGIKTTYYKVMAFSMSAFFAGIAGAVYSSYFHAINPGLFGFLRSIDILVIVVLGGMGSVTGSIIAAVILAVANTALQAVPALRMIIYSVMLVCIMIFRPQGLMGSKELTLDKLFRKIGPRKADARIE